MTPYFFEIDLRFLGHGQRLSHGSRGMLVLCSDRRFTRQEFNMRTRIVVTLLLALGTCAFAAAKKTVVQPPSSPGILIASNFGFTILGDGISTTFTINPWRIPQNTGEGTPALPLLPLAGVENGGGSCGVIGQILFTATVLGRQVIVTLAAPMAGGDQENCHATLLFHPE